MTKIALLALLGAALVGCATDSGVANSQEPVKPQGTPNPHMRKVGAAGAGGGASAPAATASSGAMSK